MADFFDANKVEVVLLALLAVSEVLAFFPKIKANGIFQLVVTGIKKIVTKK